MRALALLLLAGCYDPTLVEGLPCSHSHGCPEGQYCLPGMELCLSELPPQAAFAQISAGTAHSCAIDGEGALFCWGDNRKGELGVGDFDPHPRPTQVGTLIGWDAVAAGEALTLGIRDGVLYAWGNSDLISGASEMPLRIDPGNTWASVTAGPVAFCALDEAGSAMCLDHEPTTLLTGWDTLVAAAGHVCGLRDEGQLYCWGENAYGQVGDGTTAAAVDPVAIQPAKRWRSVAAGRAHTCAVDDAGAVWCWGRNDVGQAGQADVDALVLEPREVAFIDSMGALAEVRSYLDTTCVTGATDGPTWCFGAGGFGQVGDGRVDAINPSPRVIGVTPFSTIAVGHAHACGIDFQGFAYCWGDDAGGQLGDGELGRADEPTQIGEGGGWDRVSVGARHVCVIAEDGHAECFGRNGHGQLGDRSDLRRGLPSRVRDSLGARWAAISVGYDHTCAIRDPERTLWCWGNSARGQLGLGDGDDLDVPTQVGDTVWADVAAGDGGTCAIDEDTMMYCWGTTRGNSPVLLEDTANWTEIEAGVDGEMCAVRGGATYCWSLRDNADPAALLGDLDWDVFAKGATHACGIDTEQDLLTCAGNDERGALGDGADPAPPGVAVEPTPSGRFTHVSAGRDLTCGLREDQLYCWGWNDLGQVGDDSRATRDAPVEIMAGVIWRDVAVHESSACAIRGTDGSLWCWGRDHGAGGGWDVPSYVVAP